MNLPEQPASNQSVPPVVPISSTPTTENTRQDFTFLDRRSPQATRTQAPVERRQFGNSHSNISPEARELGNAIDQYKLINRRRYVSYEELLSIVHSLGYTK